MWEDPDALLLKKLGREEYCQRMLTSLILGARYPNWNTRNRPSTDGERFLASLYNRAFAALLDLQIEFVDEFNLPAMHADENGAAPDYAILSPTRIWLIELKTEVSSHRKDQLPMYARLAAHHHPGCQIELLYLTPEMQREVSPGKEATRFAHLYWPEISDVIREVWSISAHEEERILHAALQREIDSLHVAPRKYRNDANVIRAALTRAVRVQQTGEQCGIEVVAEGLEDLMSLRLRIRDALSQRDGVGNVKPWIWQAATSGGTALTSLGAEVGSELRLSLYPKPTHRTRT